VILKFLKNLLPKKPVTSKFKAKTKAKLAPKVMGRAEHPITRQNISANALKVLYRLKDAGFSAYLVGGSVRDLLLGLNPKDFDIATNAKPEQVYKLFRNCRLIGRRFRLAHVYFHSEIIEVATFRGHHAKLGNEVETEEGLIIRDNVYGTIEEDAERRDFTVNALYYNIKDFSIVDFHDGLTDLKAGVLRIIGDPYQRYREDPVRILRVVRFASKLGFTIHPATEQPIFESHALLQNVSPARLFDEILKLFHAGKALAAFKLLRKYGLFGYLFSQAEACLDQPEAEMAHKLIEFLLESTDKRIAEGKSISGGFLFAVILWPALQALMQDLQQEGLALFPALHEAINKVLRRQGQQISIPKRFQIDMQEIWQLQYRLAQRTPRRVFTMLNHPKFRAGYDLLILRAKAGEELQTLADWWTEFQSADKPGQHKLLKELAPKRKRRKKTPPKPKNVSE
jgi:poly(A) polymerase